MEDTLLKIFLEAQVVTSMIFSMIYLAVREDVVEDSDLFLKIYLAVAVEDSVVHVEMTFYTNVTLLWKMYYMENKLNLISRNM